ncbi:hypothetical protein PHET_06184 [Paragonimus heterotremus]|uniref:Uncharacterized protein n=1 Tax=Paragonimus heterotremus TaxID=100268 RepID=A0A8J4TK21_9TREM|nr:hypothetical protein PHET_06184 [Paragonimus heterotremus]
MMFLSMVNQTVSTTITAPAAELNTTAPNSSLSQAEELTSANVWKNRWPQTIDVNDTSVQFPTRIAFRTDDYAAYENGAEFSEYHGTRQNQMLPIYCSIMGMIIVFLLFYVVYKLWRQREAITSAKLSDAAYTVSGFKNITRAGGRSVSLSISPTGSGFQTVRCPIPDTCEVLSNTTETVNPWLSSSNEMHEVQERDPLLLDNVNKTQMNETENTGKLLNTLPVNVLGTLCFQLARKGCHKLADIMGITPNELSKSDPLYLGLLEATLHAKAFSLSTSTNRLRRCQPNAEDDELLYDAVNVICQLCKKPEVTLMTMSDALESVGRTDLIPLLTDENETNDGLNPVRNSLQGGEGHCQV